MAIYGYWVERHGFAGDWERYAVRGYRNRPAEASDHQVVGSSGIYWNVAYSFVSISEAVEAAQAFRKKWPRSRLLRVTNSNGEVMWLEGYDSVETTPQEVRFVAPVPNQTLQVPRTALIARLEERQTEEQDKRKAAQDAITKRRQDVLDAVAKLTTDQVVNIFTKYVEGDYDSLTEMANDAVENQRFVSQELKETPVETEIDKWLRVLNMASDTNIEVSPSDNVYTLL